MGLDECIAPNAMNSILCIMCVCVRLGNEIDNKIVLMQSFFSCGVCVYYMMGMGKSQIVSNAFCFITVYQERRKYKNV